MAYTAELKTEMESDLVQVVCGKDTYSIPANKLAADSLSVYDGENGEKSDYHRDIIKNL